MLKAEAVDLETFPIYMNFNSPQELRSVFDRLKQREARSIVDEIYSEEHLIIDRIVGDYLGLSHKEIKELTHLLEVRVRARTLKAKSV